MEWVGALPRPPLGVFAVHGEAEAAGTLAARIDRTLGWPAVVPSHDERVQL
jgi:metallo-beta-lactamase family protein